MDHEVLRAPPAFPSSQPTDPTHVPLTPDCRPTKARVGRSDGAGASIVGIATAVPTNTLSQNDVVRFATNMFSGRFRDFERIRPVFENSGIETRYSVQNVEWFHRPQNWEERTQAYLDGGTALFVDAAQKALAAARLKPDAIDTIVTVGSTGIATPTLEARAHKAIGFRADIRRVPVFGLGCAGGATGLALAAKLAEADPGTHVLLVIVETCTLSFRDDALTKSNIVATALFGDGAAALVLTSGTTASGPRIIASGEHLWPSTLDIMGWSVDPVGFTAIFSSSIPALVMERLRPAAAQMLERTGETLKDIDNFVFHPGGAKVIRAIETAFELGDGTLSGEREILRAFGNMSAPTVIFVLQRKIEQGMRGPTLLAALGPGFTGSFVRLEV